ncbi:AsmA family protein [Hyphomonas johnsonii]|nr:AsmA family protein [Hyphomonas johnsonii]
MKRVLLIAAGVLGVLIIAALAVPFLIPKDVYKAQIEKAATAALQRDVHLNGDVKISVFPRIAASVGGVTVANPDGFDRPNMIEAGELRGSVKWLPLLSRRVDVQELSFVDARVDLHRLANGSANWEFPEGEASASESPAPSGGGFDAGIEIASLENASVSYRDDATNAAYDLTNLNLQASLQALDQPLKASADGLFQGQTFDISLQLDSPGALTGGSPAAVKFDLDSPLAKLTYDGRVTLGEAPDLDGGLTLSAPSVAELAAFAAVDLPYNLTPLGGADVKATLSGPLAALNVTFDRLALKGQLIDASYTGALALGDAPSLEGAFTALLPQAGDLARQIGIDLPASSALERVQIKGALKGAFDALALSGLDVKHTGALLNASYQGDVGLGGDGRVTGQVQAASDELRALLKAADVEMAPGETLQTFSLDGAIKGTFKKLAMTNLKLAVDDISGTGTVGIDLSGTRPRLTGDLDMGPLDLSPFLGDSSAPQQPKAASTGWSKEPLDLAGLKAVDADVAITTPALTIGKVKMTDAVMQTKLADGRLTADLPKFKVFGGDWNGRMAVNASGAQPAIDFTMNGSGVGMSSLLGTLAGFDKLTGTGGFTVTGASSGGSLDEIMKALDGKVTTNLADGALKGLNVTQLVRSAQSLQQAVTTGSLQNLDFGSVLSPSASTDFTSFDTVMTINDGVATVNLMKLINPVLGLDGSGQINLGGQSLDLRLATSIDKSGQGTGSVVQLNGIPVPVRLSGSWSNLKVTPDLSGVQAALKAELGNKLKDQLTNKLGGDAGAILGNVLGTPSSTAPATTPPSDTPPADTAPTDTAPAEPQPATAQPSVEDLAEKAARDAIGGLFNKKKKPEDPAETPE